MSNDEHSIIGGTSPAGSVMADHDLLALSGAEPPESPGSIGSIGRFKVLSLLGAGGMGLVVLARDPSKPHEADDSLVAVKVIRPELRNSALANRRFAIEATHMQKLDHPNILRVMEVQSANDPAYYVTPYLPNGPLSRHIPPDKGMPRDGILTIAVPVADAISFAHQRGIIHRDLKPANILLADDGSPRVCDFGLVRTVYNDSIVDPSRLIQEGSAAYMSPAIAEGIAEDTRCDIYAFGATLYEMLTGRPPYEGLTPMEVMRKIRAGPPEPATSVRPGIDASLAHVASRCMARRLADRYASMNEVLLDLERCARGEPLATRRSWGIYRHRRMIVTTLLGTALAASAWTLVDRALRTSQPYLDTVPDVDRIYAAEFDRGGPGVAYSDRDAINYGDGFRPDEEPDTWMNRDDEAGVATMRPYVGRTMTGEWLAFTVNVPDDRPRRAALRIVSHNAASILRITLNDEDVSGPMSAPAGSEPWRWSTIQSDRVVRLTPGRHRLVVHVESVPELSAGTPGMGPDIRWVGLVAQGGTARPGPSTSP